MSDEDATRRNQALDFLDELDERHDYLLNELDQLNLRIDSVLNEYTKSRQLSAQANGVLEPPRDAVTSIDASNDQAEPADFD